MSDQLSAAAQSMGVPEPLVERSARAWAEASGQSYEDVLTAWAGGEAVATAPPSEPDEAPVEEAAAETEPAPQAEPAAAPPPVADEEPATAPPAAAAAAVAPPPAPETVTPDEALEYPVVVTVPTAGIAERTGFAIPAWLGTLLLIVPAFGLIYLALGASADCGVGTGLQVDRVTGVVENCDGSPFEGRGAGGGGGADFIAEGELVYAQCAGCHGPQGEGSGNFPPLTGVMDTFGACSDHIEWVSVGSAGFADVGTYGDQNKPVGAQGQMPAFGGSLSDEQLAAVVTYERVRIGGGNPDEVLADCGLGEGEEGEEGESEEGEGEEGDTQEDDADGTDDTTATTSAPEASG